MAATTKRTALEDTTTASMRDVVHAELLEMSKNELARRHAVATHSALLLLDDPKHFDTFRPAHVRLALPIHNLSLDEHDEHTLLLESPHWPAPVVVASRQHGGIRAWARAANTLLAEWLCR